MLILLAEIFLITLNPTQIMPKLPNWNLFKSIFKSEPAPIYYITQEERGQLLQELGQLKKHNVELQQSLRETRTESSAATEDLLLELLELVDAIEALLEYLNKNPEPSPQFLLRLPKSIGAVQRKFLSILAKRLVQPIEILEGTQPDFQLCRVVDQEVRNDLPQQTIMKVLRRGFRLDTKVLRPTEIITSKSD